MLTAVRRRMLVVTVSALILAAVAAGGVEAAQGEPRRDPTGALVEEGRLPLGSVRVGDCFDDPTQAETEAGAVESLRAVPCQRPHDNETYHLFTLPGRQYPGDEEVDTLASRGCLQSFEAYVGARYEDSALESVHVTPNAEAWDGGVRQAICAVYLPSGEKLTGSVQGRGLAVTDPGSTAEAGTLSGVAVLVLFVIVLALSVVQFAAMWRIFTKAGEAGWKALIPIWNVVVLLRIGGRPRWWLILFVVPVANLVVAVMMFVGLAKAFGKGIGFALGLILFGIVFLPILAFGDATYRPPNRRSSEARRPQPYSVA